MGMAHFRTFYKCLTFKLAGSLSIVSSEKYTFPVGNKHCYNYQVRFFSTLDEILHCGEGAVALHDRT